MSLFYFLNFTKYFTPIFSVLKLKTEHIKPKTYLPLLCVLWFLMSCGSHKNMATQESSIESSPKIIFLNYNIKKTADDKRSIKFINKIVTDGKLKKTDVLEDGIIGDLVCTQLDKNSNTLQRFIIKNPLVKNIEYIDESNSFQNKKIDLDSAQFSLRLQLRPNTKYIAISNFSTSENPKKPLIKTNIN